MRDAANNSISGKRFSVDYLLTGSEEETRKKAEAICVEQTVEFPIDLITENFILDSIVGKIESFSRITDNKFKATISYAIEITGFNLIQLLNAIFGNSSIKPDIRVQKFDLPDELLNFFKGPRFGKDGLRELLGVPKRPLLCSATKPLGLSSQELADMTYQYALGGIDIIKDDHGITDQTFSPFKERVKLCADAVLRANQKTGHHSIYIPSVSGPVDKIVKNAYYAKKVGVGGLLVIPSLVGWDTMRMLADDDNFGLPIMSHPSFQGFFTTCPGSGFSHFALYGQLVRLAGGDATIYPNYGGRFSFTKEECIEIVNGSNYQMGHIKPIFPTPGGGMTLQRIPQLMEIYNRDVIYLMGGGLHRGQDLVSNCRAFREMIEKL